MPPPEAPRRLQVQVRPGQPTVSYVRADAGEGVSADVLTEIRDVVQGLTVLSAAAASGQAINTVDWREANRDGRAALDVIDAALGKP